MLNFHTYFEMEKPQRRLKLAVRPVCCHSEVVSYPSQHHTGTVWQSYSYSFNPKGYHGLLFDTRSSVLRIQPSARASLSFVAQKRARFVQLQLLVAGFKVEDTRWAFPRPAWPSRGLLYSCTGLRGLYCSSYVSTNGLLLLLHGSRWDAGRGGGNRGRGKGVL